MPYKDPIVRRMKAREYSRQFHARHRAERNAASRKWNAEHREHVARRKKAWYAANREHALKKHKEYYMANRERLIRYTIEWIKKNREKRLLAQKRAAAKIRERKKRDAAYYAELRARVRRSYAKAVILSGNTYTPSPKRRIPDYAVMGQFVLDVHSPWLINNLTDSQRAYAMELAIERKERRAMA